MFRALSSVSFSRYLQTMAVSEVFLNEELGVTLMRFLLGPPIAQVGPVCVRFFDLISSESSWAGVKLHAIRCHCRRLCLTRLIYCCSVARMPIRHVRFVAPRLVQLQRVHMDLAPVLIPQFGMCLWMGGDDASVCGSVRMSFPRIYAHTGFALCFSTSRDPQCVAGLVQLGSAFNSTEFIAYLQIHDANLGNPSSVWYDNDFAVHASDNVTSSDFKTLRGEYKQWTLILLSREVIVCCPDRRLLHIPLMQDSFSMNPADTFFFCAMYDRRMYSVASVVRSAAVNLTSIDVPYGARMRPMLAHYL
jgi:hypothetical protein